MRFLITLLCLLGPLRAAPPSIVVILTDDMGYSDAGCFGGEIPTPHLDRLADEGLRFTRCFNSGMCVASRASLFTGRWWPSALRGFPKRETLPESLRRAGYRTALVGKWHLPGHPMDHGFDRFFGFLGGFADHFAGAPDYHDDRRRFTAFGKNYYSSRNFTDRAIGIIKGTDPAKPLFLMLAHQAPHNPLQAPAAAIERHRGKYLAGWQAVREARIARQREMGLISPDAPLPAPPNNLPAWDSLYPAQRDLEDLRMATYAAMIEILDRETGRLLEALEASGRADNTLVLFLSDNGADPFSVADAAMLAADKLPGDRRSNYQPGLGWAHTANTPWRLHKISQHAGGVTTGAILRWPDRIREGGRIETAALHFTDIAATLLDVAGVDASLPHAESFLPLLDGKPWQRRDPMFFQYADNRALRTPERTLVAVDGGRWELYDTAGDPLEAHDLADEHPKELALLAERWDRLWLEMHDGRPYRPESTADSPHYSPQGDRGSGDAYRPSAMPARLSEAP